ncbi:hypothetical protein GGH13_005954 [Coemansia sp. S155-1]|nr:hypothetical protein GGH13_005954 [Coemansia sp. S155-1]
MKFALAVLSALALAALSVPGSAYAQVGRDVVNMQGQSPRNAVHITDDERAQAYSLGLLNRLTTFVAEQSAKGNTVTNTGDILLADLGLDSPGSKKSVRELYNKLTVKLSDKYQYTFKDGSKKHLAPMFGVDRHGPVTSGSLQSVARLIGSISRMNGDSLALISQASGANTNDPLVKSSDIFSLAQLLEIDTRRINRMTDLVDKLASMDAVHMSQYLKEVGWTGMDDHSVKIDATSSAQSIPGMSYMFLIKDPMLEAMAKAASSFTSNTASSTAQLKPAIQDYLQQTRDGFEYIPGYNALNTLASLTNNPAIAQLTQLIGLSYRYPTASYLELALLYYRSIGMPGLDNVINYPSQFIGNIASTVVGGFISNAISGLVANILDPKSTGLPTPSATDAITRTGSMSPTPTPFVAPAVSTMKPVSSGMATSGTSVSPAASVSSSACNYFNPFNLFGGCSGPSSKSVAAPLITAQVPATTPPPRPSSSTLQGPALPSSSATPRWSPTFPLLPTAPLQPILPTAPWQPLLPHPGLTPNPTVTVASAPTGSAQTPASVLSQWSPGLLNTATPAAVSSAASGASWWSNFFNYINIFNNGNANGAATSSSSAELLSTGSANYVDAASSSSTPESKASSSPAAAVTSPSPVSAVMSTSPAPVVMITIPTPTAASLSSVPSVMSSSPAPAVTSNSPTPAVMSTTRSFTTMSTSSVAAVLSTSPAVTATSSSSAAAQVASLSTSTRVVALTPTKTAAPAPTKTSSSQLMGTIIFPHQSRQSISTATIVYKQNVSTRMTYTLYSQPATVIVSFIPEDYV